MTEANSAQKKQKKSLKSVKTKLILILIILFIIGIIIWLLYHFLKKESNYLKLSGRLEGYETDIGPKIRRKG